MLFFVLALAQVAFSAEKATGCCAVAGDFVGSNEVDAAVCTLPGSIATCATVELDGTTSNFEVVDGTCVYSGADLTEVNCEATNALNGAGDQADGVYTGAVLCSAKLGETAVCTAKDGTNDWTMTGMMTAAGCCGDVVDPAADQFVAGSCMCTAGELDTYKMLATGAATPVDTMTCGNKELASKATCGTSAAMYADQCCTSGTKATGLDKNFDAKMRMMVNMYYSDDLCATLFMETGESFDTTACTAVDGTTKYNKVSTVDTCLVLTTTEYTDDACTTQPATPVVVNDTPTEACTADAITGLKMKQKLLCEPVVVTTQTPTQTTGGDSAAMLSALLVMIAAVLKY
jgi:hypothetical protein